MTIVKLFYNYFNKFITYFTLFYGYFIAVLSLFFILDHSIIWVLTYSGLTCWVAWACSTFQAFKPSRLRPVSLARSGFAVLTGFLTGLLVQGVAWAGLAGQLRLGWPVQVGLAVLFPWPPWPVLARPGLPLGRGFPVFFIPWPARPKPGLWPGLTRLSGQALTPVFPGLAGLLMQGQIG